MSQLADQRNRPNSNVSGNRGYSFGEARIVQGRGLSSTGLRAAAYTREAYEICRVAGAMMELLRILIFGLLAAIIASLGTALYHLSSGRGDSKKLLRALTWRISLSIALFLLLMIAWRAGLITPHGLQQ
jgi:hypothetical protein